MELCWKSRNLLEKTQTKRYFSPRVVWVPL